ncbi:MAG: PaaI family thioesterase [Proteobacteria bacterium]|jgi:acyl-CoA thioesterase|nr:PaaI family thioesterase [Pseudomonadota bacterium]
MKEDIQLKLAKGTPYYGLLGIEVVEISKGFAKLKLDFKNSLTHPFGYLHGGAIASLADSAGINSILTTTNDNERALTLEMKVNYLVPVKDAVVYAEGKVIHKGKKFAVSDVDVKSVDGELIAKAIVTCSIF